MKGPATLCAKSRLSLALCALAIALAPACSSSSDGNAWKTASDGSAAGADAVGSYQRSGSATDVLVMHGDNTFCFLQDGFTVEGTYLLESSNVLLHMQTATADGQEIPIGPDDTEQTGSISGDTITDPDGEEWVQTDQPTAECPAVSSSGVTNPGEGILGRIEKVDWPVESLALGEMIEALPEELGGFERSDETFADTAEYLDTSPGAPPYAGITIAVIDPLTMEGLTSVQMLQATIGLGAGLERKTEERSLDEGAEFAYISGRVVVLEGVGEIPQDERLFLTGWTQPPDGAVFLVQAGSIGQRNAAILALIDAASLGE
jgi:hypothetical protein